MRTLNTVRIVLWYIKTLLDTIFKLGAKLDAMDKKLDLLLASQDVSDEEAITLDIDVTLEDKTIEGATNMNMTDSQQVTVTLKPKTKSGKPAPIQDGSVLWVGPAFVAVTPSADGMSAVYVAIGVGSGEGSVSADADLGAGVVTISKTFPVIVTPSQAESLDIVEGTPVEQVAAGPAPNPNTP